MIIIYLSCGSDGQAKTIGKALIDAKLVACVRRMPIRSSYWWDGEVQHDDEVLLMMESLEEKFDTINEVVAKLHSYDEYALTSVVVSQTTPGVLKWLEDSLGHTGQ